MDKTRPENCTGCDNAVTTGCRFYLYPELQWSRIRGCAMRTHNKDKAVEHGPLNPLKASKRGIKIK